MSINETFDELIKLSYWIGITGSPDGYTVSVLTEPRGSDGLQTYLGTGFDDDLDVATTKMLEKVKDCELIASGKHKDLDKAVNRMLDQLHGLTQEG